MSTIGIGFYYIRLFTICCALYSNLLACDDVCVCCTSVSIVLFLFTFRPLLYADTPKPSILIACASQAKERESVRKPLDTFYKSLFAGQIETGIPCTDARRNSLISGGEESGICFARIFQPV